MIETLTKLRPDRDLLCYFLRPSAVAAFSNTSQNGFTVSGTWRQQFDWAIVEWNRDNTFEHPALRNLPDGDLSGITLSYDETRENCIEFDSTLFPTVDWPYLRVWVDTPDGDVLHRVRLADYAIPLEGSYQPGSATFTLNGTVTAGDYVEIAWDPFSTFHYNYLVTDGDTPASVVQQLAANINSFPLVTAVASGRRLTLTLKDAGTGANLNRIGVYGGVSGSRSVAWEPAAQTFSGATSPTKWRVTLPFTNLVNFETKALVPATNVRKLRWTFAAAQQRGSYSRSDFSVEVANWRVTGSGLAYSVLGPGSRRIEDSDSSFAYSGLWKTEGGNFSGGTHHVTTAAGARARLQYSCQSRHDLLIGTRRAVNTATVTVTVDGRQVLTKSLMLANDDVLVRIPVGSFTQGAHTVEISNAGPDGTYLYLDFVDIAVAVSTLPDFPVANCVTLATDWDTDHSIALAPERTAWLIKTLGFTGRANHYLGALWFFELVRAGTRYASATLTISGEASPNAVTTLVLDGTEYAHLHLVGDSTADVTKALELQVNNGSTGVWASASQNVLTITARAMGVAGNNLAISASTTQSPASGFSVVTTGSVLSGGVDGDHTGIPYQDDALSGYLGWRTDLSAYPRINRAARDWSRSFYRALKGYGIAATGAFSTEIQFGDPSDAAAIAQRYPDKKAVTLTTPAIQTNFSDISARFWEQVYADMALIMVEAGQPPYLQFGEVQWWYIGNDSGLPFYDDFTRGRFLAQFGTSLPVITVNSDAQQLSSETKFLAALIGSFTNRIMQYVRASIPTAQFEVLYPLDVNDTPVNRLVNYPLEDWTPTALACLKTESFGYTGSRNLDAVARSISYPFEVNFPRSQSSHLVGISDPTTPWVKEMEMANGQNVESVVLFALDQYCLVGYPGHPRSRTRRSFYTV